MSAYAGSEYRPRTRDMVYPPPAPDPRSTPRPARRCAARSGVQGLVGIYHAQVRPAPGIRREGAPFRGRHLILWESRSSMTRGAEVSADRIRPGEPTGKTACAFGDQLRRAREARGLTLEAVSEGTRIGLRHLDAL